MNKQELIKGLNQVLNTYSNKSRFDIGVKTGLVTAIYEIEKLDEPEKVVIPKFAAEWIEKSKEAEYPLAYAINQTSGELGKWLHTYDLTVDIRKNQELFAKAWVNGYEVEKEKLYRIILPKRVSKKWTYCFIDRDLEVQYTHVLSAVTTHTEEQIEAYDEIYQELAVEVAE